MGQEATAAFIQLDVSDNPANYVTAEAYADRSGRVQVRVSNRSPVALAAVQLEVAAVIGGGIQRRSLRVGSLPAGGFADLATGLAFPRDSSWTPDMMSAVVTGAAP